MWRSFSAGICLALAIGTLGVVPILAATWLLSGDLGALPFGLGRAVVGLHGRWLKVIPLVPLCAMLLAIFSLRLKPSRPAQYVLAVSGVVVALLMSLLWAYHGNVPG